jgi:hypothetical protein
VQTFLRDPGEIPMLVANFQIVIMSVFIKRFLDWFTFPSVLCVNGYSKHSALLVDVTLLLKQ